MSIWDQSIMSENEAPEGFSYGTEYTREQINSALESETPWEIVPSRDTDGHGTYMAGVACGNRIEENDFAGVAPLADICVVKCKEAKQSLKDFYVIPQEARAYAEQDIMLGVRYIWQKAVKTRKPLIICLGMGTNLGGHNRGGMLGEYLQAIGDYPGVGVVVACGNEGNASHHYRSQVISAGEYTDVEINTGNGGGFTLELWSDSPQLFSVGIISPSGEYSGKITARIGKSEEVRFLLEDTVVNIEYILAEFESGDECVQIKFRNVLEGIWKLRIFNDNRYSGFFDMWLPIVNFVDENTFFLSPDPNVTLCNPSNNQGLISPSYYDSYRRSVALNSGRGYTRAGQLKPDFAAPGIDVYGPVKRAGVKLSVSEDERNLTAVYEYRSGSSAATAITAGATALLMEWGIVRKNDVSMDTVSAQKYLIRGADNQGMTEVNRVWGNGTLDLYGVFEGIRPTL